jgi:hypothetical protein
MVVQLSHDGIWTLELNIRLLSSTPTSGRFSSIPQVGDDGRHVHVSLASVFFVPHLLGGLVDTHCPPY